MTIDNNVTIVGRQFEPVEVAAAVPESGADYDVACGICLANQGQAFLEEVVPNWGRQLPVRLV